MLVSDIKAAVTLSRDIFAHMLNAQINLALSTASLFAVLTLVGCRDQTTVAPIGSATSQAVPLTKAERIAQVTHVLAPQASLPSEIIDAHFDEQPLGPPDPSGFGPVDYVSYMYLKIRPEDMSKWERLLPRKLGYVPKLNPDEDYPWWLNGKDMTHFEFFEPHPLSPRDGFVGISRRSGEIWIYGFTM